MKKCPNCEQTRTITDYPFCDGNCRRVYLIRLEKSAYFPQMHTVKIGQEHTVLKYPEFITEMKEYFSNPHKDITPKIKPLFHHHFKDFLT